MTVSKAPHWLSWWLLTQGWCDCAACDDFIYIAGGAVRLDYLHDCYSCAKFGGNPFMGGFWANRWNIAEFFSIYTHFLSNSRTHARVCLFWLSLILHPILGIKLPQNPNFWGMNRYFPAKRVKYWNVHIIKTTASIIAKFCRVIETHKYSVWVVQICPKRIQYGGRRPSLKIEKS